MKENSPCYQCDKRYETCHVSCETFITWDKLHREKREEERKKRQDESEATYTKIENVRRMKWIRKRKRR